MTASGGFFSLELRQDGKGGRGGERQFWSLSPPILECFYDRTLVSYSDFICVSLYIYIKYNRPLVFFFSLPLLFQTYTKISEGSTQLSVYRQPFKSLFSIVGQKPVGPTPFQDGRGANSWCPLLSSFGEQLG